MKIIELQKEELTLKEIFSINELYGDVNVQEFSELLRKHQQS